MLASVSIAQRFHLYNLQENKCLISGEKELCAPSSPMALEPFENDYNTHYSFNSLHSFQCLSYISSIATTDAFLSVAQFKALLLAI